MRKILPLLLLTCVLCFAVCLGKVQPAELSPEARAKVALAFVSNSPKARTCDCGGNASICTCGPNCDCPGCAINANVYKKAPEPIEWALYRVQYEKAVAQNKPLIIWVGETCPACENRWTNYLHARLTEFGGWSGVPLEQGPKVIVAKPDGLGGMNVVGRLEGIPGATAISDLLSHQRQAVQSPITCVSPMMCMPVCDPMMGGFSGGMMMGGGGGGGGC